VIAAIEKRIPHGWRVSWAYSSSKRLIIEHAFGAVTVDIDRRGFALGIVAMVPRYSTRYAGRGWRDRLVDDAVKALQAAEGRP
jgi:hypothetical protein